MTRLSSSVFAGLVSFALAVPALAQPLSSGDLPSCGDDKHDKKDEKKDPAAAPQCGDDKHDKKDEKKDPAVAAPQCGDDKHDKKDEKKDPARV